MSVHCAGIWGAHGVIPKFHIFVRHLLDFLEQNEDNIGRRTNHPDGLPPIVTNWCPHLCYPHHFYTKCPSFHNAPNLSWLLTGTKYAGLRTRWLSYLAEVESKDKALGCVHNAIFYRQ